MHGATFTQRMECQPRFDHNGMITGMMLTNCDASLARLGKCRLPCRKHLPCELLLAGDSEWAALSRVQAAPFRCCSSSDGLTACGWKRNDSASLQHRYEYRKLLKMLHK